MNLARHVPPGMKYALGRVGLFVLVAVPVVVLTPGWWNFFLKLMLAFVISAALGYVLLRRWRTEMADQLQTTMTRRAEQKERLRSALAGEDEPSDPAP
jgi:uncharacterized protein DUF4229